MKTVDSIDLFFQSGSSNKEYHIQLVEDAGKFVVNFQYGRIGSSLLSGTKTKTPVGEYAASGIYEALKSEKLGKGYISQGGSKNNYVTAAPVQTIESLVLPQLLNPVDETELDRLLRDDSYGAQEKKDGKHLLLHKTVHDTCAYNKKGIKVGFPTVFAISMSDAGLVDGEAIGDSLYVYDLLEAGNKDLRSYGYQQRYEFLNKMTFDGAIKIVPLAIGYCAKKALLDKLRAENKEGIVFKRLDAPFKAGRPSSGGDMLKHKFYATASCIVVQGRAGKRSVALELIDSDTDDRIAVGNVTIPPNKEVPLVGSIVEIRYLYAYQGGSLYQPQYLEPRDDIEEYECITAQLKYKAEEE